jgi:hypothetical protein
MISRAVRYRQRLFVQNCYETGRVTLWREINAPVGSPRGDQYERASRNEPLADLVDVTDDFAIGPLARLFA